MNVTPFTPIFNATVAAAQQTDIGKAIKDGMNMFSEGMPVLMRALDELKSLHPFIGGVFFLWYTGMLSDTKGSRCIGVQDCVPIGAQSLRER